MGRAICPLLALIALANQTQASAQDCNCDQQLGLDVTRFDGQDAGVSPGDRICVMAGERPFLRFSNLAGTEEAPLTIVNCGGRVRIHNTDRAYALVFEADSKHFHITGTGDPSYTYGFDISAPAREPYAAVGLALIGRATNYEVDHLEIHDTGFAGISAKTDPLCNGSADQDVFVQRDIDLHHLWVHDTGGEGFYVGSTQSNGQSITCDGANELHQPHFLEGVSIHDNLVEDTGWDGMQVGMARSNCAVYRNIIRHVGLAAVDQQQQGLQIGTYSACAVYDNLISDGPAMGIIVLGGGSTQIYNNLIVDFPEADSIYANQRDQVPTAEYHIAFNTLVNWGRNGITIFGAQLGPSSARSNLLVGPGQGVSAGSDVPFTAEHNLVLNDSTGVFRSSTDFHLAQNSPALGQGTTVDGIPNDLDGVARAEPPAVGAYEWAEPGQDSAPPETGGEQAAAAAGTTGGTVAGAAGGGGARGGSGGDTTVSSRPTNEALQGSGCQAASESAGPPGSLWLGIGLGLLVWRRLRLRAT